MLSWFFCINFIIILHPIFWEVAIFLVNCFIHVYLQIISKIIIKTAIMVDVNVVLKGQCKIALSKWNEWCSYYRCYCDQWLTYIIWVLFFFVLRNLFMATATRYKKEKICDTHLSFLEFSAIGVRSTNHKSGFGAILISLFYRNFHIKIRYVTKWW